MLPFSKDHPHIRSPKGVMSCDEIRFWIRELHEKHGWRRIVLARALGAHDAQTLFGKLKGKWIYPGEQLRFSRGLDRIISGELVADYPYARVADHPVPLKQPARMAYDFASGRICWVQGRGAPAQALPSFSSVLTNTVTWNPDDGRTQRL